MNKCLWYVSAEQPECGRAGFAKIKVKTAITQATITVCREHKHVHDQAAAAIRVSHQAQAASG